MLRALSVADYRSYRDMASPEYLRSVGFDTTGDSVYPDLVFSLPDNTWAFPPTSSAQSRTVGLGVIGYYGWRHDLSSGEPIYQGYLARLKRFVYWLLEQGHSVRLLIGNLGVDQRPVEELIHFVRTEGQADWQDHIIAEMITDVDDLFQQIAKCDIVVANRFHNVVCALMMGRPVVLMGYHEKNDALMAEMGLQSYCQHISTSVSTFSFNSFNRLPWHQARCPRTSSKSARNIASCSMSSIVESYVRNQSKRRQANS